jgi:6-phosphogluconate dehydrogenase
MSSYGLIGLGAIGQNLALNIQRKTDIHVYNRTTEKVDELMKKGLGIRGHNNICGMLAQMEEPRTIITTLPHGETSDYVIKHMLKTLSPLDTVIDCSNEYYRTSRTRGAYLAARGIRYIGAGLSGGAKGALHGPSLMLGCTRRAYENNKDFLEVFCKNVTYMGNDFGHGHFTKMVHNGVEYGMLQGMADVYSYCNQDQQVMLDIMNDAYGTDIDGFLTNSAIDVLKKYEIHKISDIAQMNQTGIWCAQVGLEYGIPTPMINSALNARTTSSYAKSLETTQKTNIFYDRVLALNTLRFVFASSVAEGFDIMGTRNIKKNRIQKAWSKGTIIECPVVSANLYEVMEETADDARTFVMHCAMSHIPCPAVQAALTQFDFKRQRRTSMNFLMAQRNQFGQHKIYEA